MIGADQILVFELDERRYALPISMVNRVIHAVEITPLPGAHQGVLGLINVRGRLLCVVDIRAHLGMPRREIELSDRIILIQSGNRSVAIPVDAVAVVTATNAQPVAALESGPSNDRIQGLLKDGSKIVGICYVAGLISHDCLSPGIPARVEMEVPT